LLTKLREESYQNAHDGNHHQQLNERKSTTHVESSKAMARVHLKRSDQ
jgi:hypothetical protein